MLEFLDGFGFGHGVITVCPGSENRNAVPTPAFVWTPPLGDGSLPMKAAINSDLPGGGSPTDTMNFRLACAASVNTAGPLSVAHVGRLSSWTEHASSGASVA